MTKDDKDWLSDVAELGCIVCRNLGFGSTPAEIHHIRTGQGAGQRANHKEPCLFALHITALAVLAWQFMPDKKDMGGQIRYRTGAARSGNS